MKREEIYALEGYENVKLGWCTFLVQNFVLAVNTNIAHTKIFKTIAN